MTTQLDRKELLAILRSIEEQITYLNQKLRHNEAMREIVTNLLTNEVSE